MSGSVRSELKGNLEKEIDWAVRREAIKCSDIPATCESVNVTDNIREGCSSAQLVIEAVPEDIALKRRIFNEIDTAAPEFAVLASNTSSLSLSAIAAATNRPTRVVGMHFFNPPMRMRLVEIVKALGTSDDSIIKAIEYARLINKTPVVVKDSPGFVTSRISAMVGNEAFFMLQEGLATAEDIDSALNLGLSFPMGPLALGDLVGLDVRLGVLEYLHRSLGEKFRPCPLLVEYVDAGRLGRKTGIGVYSYDQMGKRMPNSAVSR
jgi:3-hydroxybutyryl-CoA dehydrogenase